MTERANSFEVLGTVTDKIEKLKEFTEELHYLSRGAIYH